MQLREKFGATKYLFATLLVYLERRDVLTQKEEDNQNFESILIQKAFGSAKSSLLRLKVCRQRHKTFDSKRVTKRSQNHNQV